VRLEKSSRIAARLDVANVLQGITVTTKAPAVAACVPAVLTETQLVLKIAHRARLEHAKIYLVKPHS
jgi:hypothetical protein